MEANTDSKIKGSVMDGVMQQQSNPHRTVCCMVYCCIPPSM